MDLSQTQRIVLLIDLHPLLHLQNPNPYITPVLSTIKKILSFPPLSSSLSAFKLFFSSLSPILSTSKVHRLLGKSPSFLSFNHNLQTLNSLSQTLISPNLVDPTNPTSPDLSILARLLLQLEHDYSWESDTQNPKGSHGTLTIRSNLVLLFSPIYPEYLDMKSLNFDVFLEKFFRFFGPVNEKFVSRDIHFSWIDVNFKGQCKEEGLGFLERGVTELGWGFYSTDAIMLGSALVPVGLIFPYIGCTMGFAFASNFKKGSAELVLGITDVSGEPLECKSCGLEVINLKLARERLDIWGVFSKNCDSNITKIRVREVWRREEGLKVIENSCGLVLLRGVSGECRKDSAGHYTREFFADRVLELLCTGKGEFNKGKPVWQLLLAFLFNRNYWASVSISDGDGNSLVGILKPFTINYALLSVIEKNNLDSCQLIARMSEGSSEMFHSSISAASKSKDGRRKRNKLHKNLPQDVTWSTFYEAVFSQVDIALEMDLEKIYFSMESNKSKKLRFLKCWMRQIKKSRGCCLIKPNDLKEPPHVDEDVKERVFDSQQEREPHVSSSPAREAHLNGPINEEASSFSCLEDLEAFIGSVPQKIEHGLCSEEVDLWNLAKRLVGLSVDALYVRFGKNAREDSVSKEAEDPSNVNVAAEVSRLFLVKPKDLMLKYKSFNSSYHTDQISPIYSTEYKIREHELQILFRMEILRSKIAASLEENVKQKMIKEICSVLQNIEFYLQGDFFCGESLLEFAGRTIKSRYANYQGDVVRKIYYQMEFFSFDGDEVEASDSLPGSNNEEVNRDGDENDNIPGDASGLIAKASSSQITVHLEQSDEKSQQGIMDNAHEQRLMKAHARRDRARRFSSFTSWVPDLQRVWALKQPRAEKSMHDCLPKTISKRKKRWETKSEMVCETPMTGKRHSHGQEDSGRGMDRGSCDNNSCRSLSKALFQHEGDFEAG